MNPQAAIFPRAVPVRAAEGAVRRFDGAILSGADPMGANFDDARVAAHWSAVA